MDHLSADVVVIIPVYNRAHVLKETLDRVKDQTWSPVSLVIVDDGSSDATPLVISEWYKKNKLSFPVIKLRQENKGVSAARNAGLRAAPPSEFVAFLDSDDLWPPDFLERSCAALAAHPDIVGTICHRSWPPDWRYPIQSLRRAARRIFAWAGGRWLLRTFAPNFLPNDIRYFPKKPVHWILRYGAALNSCTVYRRKFTGPHDGFDESLPIGEDSVFYLNITQRGQWLFVDGPSVGLRRDLDKYGDAGNLSRAYPDRHRRWANIYETYFAEHDVSPLISQPDMHKELRRIWCIAARELRVMNDIPGALECINRAHFHRNAWRS